MKKMKIKVEEKLGQRRIGAHWEISELEMIICFFYFPSFLFLILGACFFFFLLIFRVPQLCSLSYSVAI